MKFRTVISLGILLSSIHVSSQFKNPEIFIETSAFVSAGKNAPFWLLSNQYGKYTNHWYNIKYSAGAKSVFDTIKTFDYGYGVEIMNRIDDHYTIYPHELYIAGKLWFFDIHAGWREEVFGNAYPGLTSGNILWSGNARPMPKISINIPKFTPVPFTKGFLAFKGNIAHGWFEKDRYVKGVLMHHKSLIGQIGGNLPITGHYGLHHFAQWGGESPNPIYGKMPSDLDAFLWILQARESAPGDTLGGETKNRYGNHIGSRNIGLDYNAKKWKGGFYWQTIFEDTSGKAWSNIKDGLWGFYFNYKHHILNTIVIEFFNFYDQSGPKKDSLNQFIREPDNYFNSYIYRNGWSYFSQTIGTPLITSPIFTNNDILEYNNRVMGINIGIACTVSKKMNFRTKITYTKNKGTYYYPFTSVKNQINTSFDLLINGSKNSFYNIYLELNNGKLHGNNIGVMVKYKKSLRTYFSRK